MQSIASLIFNFRPTFMIEVYNHNISHFEIWCTFFEKQRRKLGRRIFVVSNWEKSLIQFLNCFCHILNICPCLIEHRLYTPINLNLWLAFMKKFMPEQINCTRQFLFLFFDIETRKYKNAFAKQWYNYIYILSN